MSTNSQFDSFLNALYKNSQFKNQLILWTFFGLVAPVALLAAAGVPENIACIIMVAGLPLVFFRTALKLQPKKPGVGLNKRHSTLPRQKQETLAREIFKTYISQHFGEIGTLLLSIIADYALLMIWLIVEYCIERFLVPAFHDKSMIASVFLSAFRIIFSLSIFISFAFILSRHLRIFWIKTEISIAQIRDTVSEEKHTRSRSIETPPGAAK